MIKQVKHWLLTFSLLLCCIMVNAYDFEEDGIYYNILSTEDATCEVTFGEGPVSDGYMPTYAGNVEIPEVVSDGWFSWSTEFTVVGIGDYAFSGCELDNISLPETIKQIGEGAFSGCEFDCISLPETIKQIGDEAFYYCQGISSLILPQSVEHIGYRAFAHSDFGGSLTIPLCCKCIGKEAFVETKITSLSFEPLFVMPSLLCTIGDLAFLNCDLLESVNLQFLAYNIGDNPFAGCDKLIEIEGEGVYTNDERTQGTHLIDGCLYYFTEENKVRNLELICCPAGKESYVSPNWFIEAGAEHVLVSLGDCAFVGCEKITFLDIPNTVKKIGEYSLYMPIGEYDYTYRKVIIPESVEEIGKLAFGYYGFNWDIYIHSTKIEGFYPSFEIAKYGDIHIPLGTKSSFIEKNPAVEVNFNIIEDIGAMISNLAVSSAGYATLYLDYAAEIPDDVKVYIATSVEGDRLMMTQVTGVLPAETGVIVRAKEGTYTFVESNDTPANVEGNLLSGTAEATYITAESGYRYYVLAQKEGMVGMYRPKLTDGRFLNNANKAYLRLESDDLGVFDDETNTEDEGGQLSNRLRFDFGGTTDIEKTTDNGGQTTVIHDLHGRRIIDAEGLKGVYIVNGSKVIF